MSGKRKMATLLLVALLLGATSAVAGPSGWTTDVMVQDLSYNSLTKVYPGQQGRCLLQFSVGEDPSFIITSVTLTMNGLEIGSWGSMILSPEMGKLTLSPAPFTIPTDSQAGGEITFRVSYSAQGIDEDEVTVLVIAASLPPTPSRTGGGGSADEPAPKKPSYEEATIGRCKEFVNVRSGPGLSSDIIGKAVLGETIGLTQWDSTNTWCKVLYDGGNRIGWVYHKFIVLK